MNLKGKPITLNGKRVIVLGMRIAQVNTWECACLSVEDGKFFYADVDNQGVNQICQTLEKEFGVIMPRE